MLVINVQGSGGGFGGLSSSWNNGDSCGDGYGGRGDGGGFGGVHNGYIVGNGANAHSSIVNANGEGVLIWSLIRCY